jgi:hypothetical protein
VQLSLSYNTRLQLPRALILSFPRLGQHFRVSGLMAYTCETIPYTPESRFSDMVSELQAVRLYGFLDRGSGFGQSPGDYSEASFGSIIS